MLTDDEDPPLENFVPSKFIFVDFYNRENCIIWNKSTIVILDYPLPESLTNGTILKAPGEIKDIKYLRNKVYVFCSPSGIWKLSQDNTFARISNTAIGIGTVLYHVFSPKNNILYCKDKDSKEVTTIFNILGDVENIKFYHLFTEEVHTSLQNTLIGNDDDSCLISNQNNLVNFNNNKTKILFNCDAIINDITVFHKNGKIFGIILITDAQKVVFIYPRGNKLKIEQIGLDSHVKTLCAGICSFDETKVWIMYCDGEYTYHLLKSLSNDDLPTTLSRTEKEFLCLMLYKTEKLSGLSKSQSDSVCFFQVPIEELELADNDSEEADQIELRPEMISGINSVMDQISEKVMELTKVTEELEKQRNLMRRINMYTIKYRIECIPKITTFCLPDKKWITANFQKHLPQESQVVMSIHQDNGQMFVIKKVTDSETIVKLSVLNGKICHPMSLRVHSIIVNKQQGPWFLINDFIKDPVMRQDAKKPLTKEKLTFLHSKKAELTKLIADNKIDMQTLSDIKTSIRRELPEV